MAENLKVVLSTRLALSARNQDSGHIFRFKTGLGGFLRGMPCSLRSSRFRFLQAKRGKRTRALGKKEQKQRERGGGGRGGEGKERFPFLPRPSPPLLLFLLLFAQCPRALAPLGLKETETTATQARCPEGSPYLKLGWISCFFFFMVASNLVSPRRDLLS